jgi:hypothetical protein
MRSKHFSFPVNPIVGSNVANILAICRQHKIDRRYYPKLALTITVAGIFEIFNAWERIRLKSRIKNYELKEKPLFIIGFWRSGTTFLHNILCRDLQAGYTSTFQVVFPHTTITQAWWLKKLTNLLLPPNRPFDNVEMHMDFPQEEEFGLAFMQPYSFYNAYMFPCDFERIFIEEFYTANLPVKHLDNWKNKYALLVKKAMLNTGGIRYTSKNPCNLGRIELLNSMYPGAQFIFIYRNPYHAVESLYRFMLAIFPGTQLQKLPVDFNREKIVKFYAEVVRNYFNSKTILSEGQLIEIRLEDFVRDKIIFIENIYKKFDLYGFKNAKPHFEAYLAQTSNYARDAYEIPVETYMLMNEYASDVILKLGYDLKEV